MNGLDFVDLAGPGGVLWNERSSNFAINFNTNNQEHYMDDKQH